MNKSKGFFKIKDYCYWPASGATIKIQKMSLPDKKKWRKYRCRQIGKGRNFFKNKFLILIITIKIDLIFNMNE